MQEQAHSKEGQREPAQSCGRSSVWERTGRAWSVAVARGQVGTYAVVGLIQCIPIDKVLWKNERVGFEGRGSHRDMRKGKPEEREEALLSANWPCKMYTSSWLRPSLGPVVSGLC